MHLNIYLPVLCCVQVPGLAAVICSLSRSWHLSRYEEIIIQFIIHSMYTYGYGYLYWLNDQCQGCTFSMQKHMKYRRGLTHYLLRYIIVILKVWFWNSLYRIVSWQLAMKVVSGKCHRASVMGSQHWFKLWHFVRGNYQSLVNFPHKGRWRRALMFSLICASTNGWANHCDTGDLRRRYAYYNVTVMSHE